jgi:hypothetical protein
MRYGCFEIRTSCSSCGQSLPLNGPYRKVTCTACFSEISIPADIVSGFLNDFEEEYEGLEQGQGQGGTLMSGSGTYKYGTWRLPPRCSSCKKPLPVAEEVSEGPLRCSCGADYHLFPAPDWLKRDVPSVVFCITAGPPPGESGELELEPDEESVKPIVMSCPNCAGALSISAASERVMSCGFCNTEVYVPDAVWKRLHPVSETVEWFAGFEGSTLKQLQARRRIKDQKEEEEYLSGWKLRHAPKRAGRKLRPFLYGFGVFVLAVLAIALIMLITGTQPEEVSGKTASLFPVLVVIAAVGIPLYFVFRTSFSSKLGRGKECKAEIARLAEKHGWKHEAAEYKSTLGYIDDRYRGRDIEIDPGDDYAITVEINDSPFYLRTEPPGYPHDGVQRFTSGDERLDDTFPIRYATKLLAEEIEGSKEGAERVLAPLNWFLDRWSGKLGRMQVDWSEVGVHLTPGHIEVMDSGNRYLMPEDMEPLLEDMVVLAKAIDAIASGREPELPENPPEVEPVTAAEG